MSRMPFGGLVWGTIQYIVGFQRLGHEVYYVEAHGSTPRSFIEKPDDDPWAEGAEYINGVMQRLGLGDRWAFHALHDGRCFGKTEAELKALYGAADLIINVHGATVPREEMYATGRLVYLDTDPVEVQIEADLQNHNTLDALGRHCAFFTRGFNFGHPDGGVPRTSAFHFHPSPPPIVHDFWESPSGNGGNGGNGRASLLTTIGNWRQEHCDLTYRGEVYRWSKHHEFLKVIDLPRRTEQRFELALSSYSHQDRALLEQNGWRVRDA